MEVRNTMKCNSIEWDIPFPEERRKVTSFPSIVPLGRLSDWMWQKMYYIMAAWESFTIYLFEKIHTQILVRWGAVTTLGTTTCVCQVSIRTDGNSSNRSAIYQGKVSLLTCLLGSSYGIYCSCLLIQIESNEDWQPSIEVCGEQINLQVLVHLENPLEGVMR